MQVLSLKSICLCSDSLSKMCSRGPLLSEQRRQRSVKAVKLRSSGSVIAKHLMRRSRRHELSMCTAVWEGVGSTHVAGAGREASRRRCVREALCPRGRHPATLPPRVPPAHASRPLLRGRGRRGAQGAAGKRVVFPLNAVCYCSVNKRLICEFVRIEWL